MPRFILSDSGLDIKRILDIRPDDTDARDYIFQPSLTLLPEMVDNRKYSIKVLDQGTEGACVGFALAAVINTSLKKRKSSEKDSVSSRMLYEMAQGYDEWEGENYEGTSLRGAMKGWHKHGVATEALWAKFQDGEEGVDSVLKDAFRRPLGAYYRITDSDVVHIQAAIVEGDAVLASAWVHSGWENNKLFLEKKEPLELKRILKKIGKKGLHAFAIVGYTPYGFIIQNSWSEKWGSGGYAILGYDDWFENRQDAWVARPGPETKDSKGKAKIFLDSFKGNLDTLNLRTSTTIYGLDLDPQLEPFLINTGDNGELSTTGRIRTREEDLPDMARQVLTTPSSTYGLRHVILYVHGGVNSERKAAETANRLFLKCKEKGVGAYFFIWESGLIELLYGWLTSTGNALGPVEFDLFNFLKGKWVWAQKEIGKWLAPTFREIFWGEGIERAKGASEQPKGGANLFVRKLFDVLSSMPDDNYRIHLVGHSFGSIYLAYLYENALKSLLLQHPTKAQLASIQFMAPAILIEHAKSAFSGITKDKFLVYMLSEDNENNDNIGIYPHSVLKYVHEHADANGPTSILGIREDFDSEVNFATPIEATKSEKHQEFEDEGYEIEDIIEKISNDEFV